MSGARRGPERVLCLVPSPDESARTRESRPADADSGLLSGVARAGTGVRGFIRSCGPTGSRSAAIAWRG